MSYILLHGLGQTSSSWNETIQTLNEDRNIFCPDLSDWIMGKQPCYDTLYKAFEKYCEQFDDTLCLVGLSLGGILAMQYSMEHSEKVKSLVLIGTQYKMPRRLLKLQNVLFHLMPDSKFSKMGFQKSDFISLCKSMIDLDFSHQLKDIRCKVLVVCGEKDRANRSASLQLAELIPDRKYGRPLEKNDRKKALTLLEKGMYPEEMTFMLEQDCKIEQEIVSWMLENERNKEEVFR